MPMDVPAGISHTLPSDDVKLIPSVGEILGRR